MLKFFLIGIVIAQASLLAHTGVGSISGFEAGFTHPMGGEDHILAMFAVGLWAAQMGGRSLWAVPLSFVTVMVIGAFFAIQGAQVSLIEGGIFVSLLVLGAVIGLGVRVPVVFASVLVGILAIFHGMAHGSEMPLNTSGIEYGLGFVLATGLLHVSGIVVGLILSKIMKSKIFFRVKRTNV